MANTLLPVEERSLSPDEVELLDRRRRRGQAMLVICFMCLIVSTLLILWAGQDAELTYGPMKPMVIWLAITSTIAIVTGLYGLSLRRGINEFFSY